MDYQDVIQSVKEVYRPNEDPFNPGCCTGPKTVTVINNDPVDQNYNNTQVENILVTLEEVLKLPDVRTKKANQM